MVIWLVVFCIPEYQMSRGLLQWVTVCAVSWICVLTLQLYDSQASSTYGAAQCYPLVSGCQGAVYDSTCYPYHIWSETLSNSKYYAPYLIGGTLGIKGPCSGELCPVSIAFSVRCVLDLYILFCRVFIRKQYRQICSYATSGRAISTVLHSVILFMTAVRAQAGETQGGMTIAGLLNCGPAAAVSLYITEGI